MKRNECHPLHTPGPAAFSIRVTLVKAFGFISNCLVEQAPTGVLVGIFCNNVPLIIICSWFTFCLSFMSVSSAWNRCAMLCPALAGTVQSMHIGEWFYAWVWF